MGGFLMLAVVLAALLATSPTIEVFHYPVQYAVVQGAVVIDLNVLASNRTTWKFKGIQDKTVAIIWGTADVACREPKPGCISQQKFVFKALKPGKTQAVFELVHGTK